MEAFLISPLMSSVSAGHVELRFSTICLTSDRWALPCICIPGYIMQRIRPVAFVYPKKGRCKSLDKYVANLASESSG